MITILPKHVISPAKKIRIDSITMKIDPAVRKSTDEYAQVLLTYFDDLGAPLQSESVYLSESDCANWGEDDQYIINKVLEKINAQRDEA